MIEEAKAKIQKETDAAKDPNTKLIGSYVLEVLCKSEENAAKVAEEKKTLDGCMADMRTKAKAHAQHNCAMVDGNTIIRWVKAYFGARAAQADEIAWYTRAFAGASEAPKQEAAPAAEPADDGHIDLFDLM